MSVFRFVIISCGCVCWSVFAQAQLQVKDAYVRGLPPGQPNTAAYMRLLNSSDRAIKVTGVKTSSAAKAEFHSHSHHNGMMKMEKVDSIIVPAAGVFTLKPGGHHLMLFGLREPLHEGDKVKLELSTDKGDVYSAELDVRSVLNE